MKEKKQELLRAAGITAGVLTAVAGISYLVTGKLVELAIKRKSPFDMNKTMEVVAGSGEMKAILEKQSAAAEALLSLPHEDIGITGFDGTRLVGHYYPAECPKRILIAFHGWRSSYDRDFGLIAPMFAGNDCDVLYVEQRGQNGSEGDYMGFGLLERYDALSWANYVNGRGASLPVYLVGLSMGATTVLMASGLELPSCVHGILADCGYTSPDAIWKHITEKNLHLGYSELRRLVVEDMCKRHLNQEDSRYSAADALKNCRVPVLFVHGADDHFVPVHMAYENYLACPTEKRLLIVPGADHGMSFLTEPGKYIAACTAFWQDFDEAVPAIKEETSSAVSAADDPSESGFAVPEELEAETA